MDAGGSNFSLPPDGTPTPKPPEKDSFSLGKFLGKLIGRQKPDASDLQVLQLRKEIQSLAAEQEGIISRFYKKFASTETATPKTHLFTRFFGAKENWQLTIPVDPILAFSSQIAEQSAKINSLKVQVQYMTSQPAKKELSRLISQLEKTNSEYDKRLSSTIYREALKRHDILKNQAMEILSGPGLPDSKARALRNLLLASSEKAAALCKEKDGSLALSDELYTLEKDPTIKLEAKKMDHETVGFILNAIKHCSDECEAILTPDWLQPLMYTETQREQKQKAKEAIKGTIAPLHAEVQLLHASFDIPKTTQTAVLLDTRQHIGKTLLYHVKNLPDTISHWNVTSIARRVDSIGSKLLKEQEALDTALEPLITSPEFDAARSANEIAEREAIINSLEAMLAEQADAIQSRSSSRAKIEAMGNLSHWQSQLNQMRQALETYKSATVSRYLSEKKPESPSASIVSDVLAGNVPVDRALLAKVAPYMQELLTRFAKQKWQNLEPSDTNRNAIRFLIQYGDRLAEIDPAFAATHTTFKAFVKLVQAQATADLTPAIKRIRKEQQELQKPHPIGSSISSAMILAASNYHALVSLLSTMQTGIIQEVVFEDARIDLANIAKDKKFMSLSDDKQKLLDKLVSGTASEVEMQDKDAILTVVISLMVQAVYGKREDSARALEQILPRLGTVTIATGDAPEQTKVLLESIAEIIEQRAPHLIASYFTRNLTEQPGLYGGITLALSLNINRRFTEAQDILYKALQDIRLAQPVWVRKYLSINSIAVLNQVQQIIQQDAAAANITLAPIPDRLIDTFNQAYEDLKSHYASYSDKQADLTTQTTSRTATLHAKLEAAKTPPRLRTAKDERAIGFQKVMDALTAMEQATIQLAKTDPARAALWQATIQAERKKIDESIDGNFMLLSQDKADRRRHLLEGKLSDAHDPETPQRLVLILRSEMAKAAYLPPGKLKMEAIANMKKLLENLHAANEPLYNKVFNEIVGAIDSPARHLFESYKREEASFDAPSLKEAIAMQADLTLFARNPQSRVAFDWLEKKLDYQRLQQMSAQDPTNTALASICAVVQESVEPYLSDASLLTNETLLTSILQALRTDLEKAMNDTDKKAQERAESNLEITMRAIGKSGTSQTLKGTIYEKLVQMDPQLNTSLQSYFQRHEQLAVELQYIEHNLKQLTELKDDPKVTPKVLIGIENEIRDLAASIRRKTADTWMAGYYELIIGSSLQTAALITNPKKQLLLAELKKSPSIERLRGIIGQDLARVTSSENPQEIVQARDAALGKLSRFFKAAEELYGFSFTSEEIGLLTAREISKMAAEKIVELSKLEGGIDSQTLSALVGSDDLLLVELISMTRVSQNPKIWLTESISTFADPSFRLRCQKALTLSSNRLKEHNIESGKPLTVFKQELLVQQRSFFGEALLEFVKQLTFFETLATLLPDDDSVVQSLELAGAKAASQALLDQLLLCFPADKQALVTESISRLKSNPAFLRQLSTEAKNSFVDSTRAIVDPRALSALNEAVVIDAATSMLTLFSGLLKIQPVLQTLPEQSRNSLQDAFPGKGKMSLEQILKYTAFQIVSRQAMALKEVLERSEDLTLRMKIGSLIVAAETAAREMQRISPELTSA